MPRPRIYPDDLQDRLVEAAAQRLAAGGIEALSLRELAASQGTSTNAIYSLFGGKGELVRQVVIGARRRLMAALLAAIKEHSRASFFALAHAYRTWALDNLDLYTVMFSGIEADDGHSQLAGLEEFAPIVELAGELAEQGEISGENIGLTLTSLWASLHGWVLLETQILTDSPREENEQRYEQHLRTFFYGCHPRD